MARKSKTQKAKASAARAQRKAERELEELTSAEETTEGNSKNAEAESEKKTAIKKSESDKSGSQAKSVSKKSDEKDKKPKKTRFQFLRDVRGELKRVTWPTRKDVTQWSVVVVAALIFFGAYVAILDNLVITPALIGVSSIEVPADESVNDSTAAKSDESATDADASEDATNAEDSVADVASDLDGLTAEDEASEERSGDMDHQIDSEGAESSESGE